MLLFKVMLQRLHEINVFNTALNVATVLASFTAVRRALHNVGPATEEWHSRLYRGTVNLDDCLFQQNGAALSDTSTLLLQHEQLDLGNINCMLDILAKRKQQLEGVSMVDCLCGTLHVIERWKVNFHSHF